MKKTVCRMLLLALVIGALFSAFPVTAAEASKLPLAPVSLEYSIDEIGSGIADGVVTVTLPAGHGAEDIYLFWGDENGKLPGYTAFSPFKVSGNVVKHSIRGDVIIPQGATRLLAYTYSDAKGLSESYASCPLPNGAAMNEDLLGTPIFEFQSVSDIHITTTVKDRLHHSDHMRAMLRDIMALSPNSIGIFNNGDTVNNGTDADYEEFLKIHNEFAGAPAIYSSMGNHELFRYGSNPVPSNKFSESTTAFWSFMGAAVPEDAAFCGGTRYGSLNYSFVRNGCKFIFLGTDVSDQNYLSLSATTLSWLKAEFDSAQEGKPTFIIMHQPMYGTLAGSFKDGYGVKPNTTEPLKELLSQYPEVIMFNGHTHRDMNQYGIHYSRDEKLPNIFGTSSVGYLARAYDSSTTETYRGSEGYYVYVYGDKVIVRGRDFLKGEWISSAQFVVDLSKEGIEKLPEPEVEAPLYGSTTDFEIVGNKIGGKVKCILPVNNNASVMALFFASADTGIIGSDPFATREVNNKEDFFTCEIAFAGVTIPYTADYILVYSYSDTLGWSTDCDVINLKTYTKGGGAPSSGSFTMNKYSFAEGEPIIVTAHKNVETSWIGFRNLASTSASTLNYWRISDVGIGTEVDLTQPNSAFKRTFSELEPGVYEIGWIEVSGGGFSAGKTPENTTVFVIHPDNTDNVSASGAVKTDKRFYYSGEAINVTATKGTAEDWIGMQLTGVGSGTALWYKLGVSGLKKEFNITKKSSFTGIEGTEYKYARLEAGEYQLAWVSASKTDFQAGKKAEDTVKITVVDMSEMLMLGVPVGDGVTDPNPSVLNAALEEVSRLDPSDYTAESWQQLQSAVGEASAVKNAPDHTQEDLDMAYEAILNALSALVKDTSKPDQGNNGNGTEPSETVSPDEGGTDATTEKPDESGCGSAVASIPLCLLMACAPLVLKKRK